MKIDVNIQGIEDLNKVFSQLPRSMQTKAYYRALFTGAGIVRRAAEQNVRGLPLSEATGTLAKNIRTYRLKKRRNGFFRVAVRVRKGAVNKMKKDKDGNPVRVGLYGSVLEYGKKNQAPRSWLRKAISSEKSRAVQGISTGMRKHMVEALNDAKNKAGVGGKRYKVQ